MRSARPANAQRGVAAVEFALIATLFLTLLLGVVEMGRLLWTWNAAVEATRFGARLAAVCDINDPIIKTRMIGRLPALAAGNITLTYLNPPNADNTCDASNCKAVRVELVNFQHDLLIPLFPGIVPAAMDVLNLPPFRTTLRKEFMSSAANEVCQ